MICESCGATDETTTEVRRIYVTPEAWDAEAAVSVDRDTERWCDVCVLHYPHQTVESPGESA